MEKRPGWPNFLKKNSKQKDFERSMSFFTSAKNEYLFNMSGPRNRMKVFVVLGCPIPGNSHSSQNRREITLNSCALEMPHLSPKFRNLFWKHFERKHFIIDYWKRYSNLGKDQLAFAGIFFFNFIFKSL